MNTAQNITVCFLLKHSVYRLSSNCPYYLRGSITKTNSWSRCYESICDGKSSKSSVQIGLSRPLPLPSLFAKVLEGETSQKNLCLQNLIVSGSIKFRQVSEIMTYLPTSQVAVLSDIFIPSRSNTRSTLRYDLDFPLRLWNRFKAFSQRFRAVFPVCTVEKNH